ncbi:hypothetical protein IF1G_01006 [Cordyceps javanica]|uniref:Uncharacterized protein n=1 Tax=Cordyceps javanica TaxID=43265 RepID=A0A545VH72_9HYPO|nr:hypothetical protein IF1G_01006 [Cordyceps javanica]
MGRPWDDSTTPRTAATARLPNSTTLSMRATARPVLWEPSLGPGTKQNADSLPKMEDAHTGESMHARNGSQFPTPPTH